MPRAALLTTALLLCLSCTHENPVQPPPPPPPPPPPSLPPPTGNQSPSAHITGPTAAREGQNLWFTAAGSSDPEGGHLTYLWDFGNGFVELSQDAIPAEYRDEGVYTVRLVARDDSGAADTASVSVAVTNTPPQISEIAAPGQQTIGIEAATQIAISDSGFTDTLVVTIHWGDGKTDSVVGAHAPWGSVSLLHSYATPGSFQIIATARDNDGDQTSKSNDKAVVVFDSAEHKTIAGYEVRDLGTLGGNDARPHDINDRGQVVGSSVTRSGTTHGFMWDGTLHDLGALGYQNSNAAFINEAGLIAGELWTNTDEYYPSPSVAAQWQGGAWRVLGGTQPRPPVLISALDDAGVIAVSEFHWQAGVGWVWRNGEWLLLANLMPDVPGNESYANAMTARGQIVGKAPYRLYGTGRLYHAALWAGDSVHDLGVLAPYLCDSEGDCSRSEATAINEAGQVVGFSTGDDGTPHFVAWEDGKIIDLGPARAAISFQGARVFINAGGQIAASAGGEAFFWDDAKSARITIPAPLGGVNIVGLTGNGDVVGSFLTPSGQHVFIWSQSRGMIDLGTGPHGFSCATAVGINERGDIIGFAAPCAVVAGPALPDRVEARPILWLNRQ